MAKAVANDQKVVEDGAPLDTRGVSNKDTVRHLTFDEVNV